MAQALTGVAPPLGAAQAGAGGARPTAASGPTATVDDRRPARNGPDRNGLHRRRRRRPWVIGLALVVLGGGAAGIGALYDASPKGTTDPSASGPAAPGASPSEPDLGSVAPVGETRFLSDDDPVETDTKTSAYASGSVSSPAVLNGTRYGHTITMDLRCGNTDGGDYWIDYATDRRWDRLTATAGLSDDSSASTRGTWTLLADGRPLVDGTLALGRPTPVDVPVQGVLRLRLKVHDDGELPGACPSGHKTVMVWGEPTPTR